MAGGARTRGRRSAAEITGRGRRAPRRAEQVRPSPHHADDIAPGEAQDVQIARGDHARSQGAETRRAGKRPAPQTRPRAPPPRGENQGGDDPPAQGRGGGESREPSPAHSPRPSSPRRVPGRLRVCPDGAEGTGPGHDPPRGRGIPPATVRATAPHHVGATDDARRRRRLRQCRH